MTTDDKESTKYMQVSGTYLALVGGLLFLIIATLAMLWIRERNRADDQRRRAEAAETALGDTQNKMQIMGQLMGGPGGHLFGGGGEKFQPFQRENVVPRKVPFEGQDRSLFTITSGFGQRIGFNPGDLIIVAPAPTTSPTTRSSSE
jgi:hypothetical protein